MSVMDNFKVASLLSACLIFLGGCASPLGTFGSGVAGGYPSPTSATYATLDVGRKYHLSGAALPTYFNLNGKRLLKLGVREGYRIRVEEGVHDICISISSDMREQCFINQPAGEFTHPIKGRSLLMLDYLTGVIGVEPARYCYENTVMQFYEITCEEWDERYPQVTLVN